MNIDRQIINRKRGCRSCRKAFTQAAAAVLMLSVLMLTGCGHNAGEEAESTETGSAAVIDIMPADEPETEKVIQMTQGEDLLPVLPDVTTAADNAVLAPTYLRPGDRHAVVAQLQEKLMSLGFMDNDEPTTYYGDATAEAVRHFQRQHGMQQDGICGTETWDLLFSGNAGYYKVKNGDDGNDIALIQQRLYQLGYLPDDSVTGHFGDTTEQAVRKLQERNSLETDGTVGRNTIALLYSDEVQANIIGFGEQSDLVRKYQQRLVELGYLRSEPDGNFGGDTQKALKEFQSRNDQVVDGYLGPGTRDALDSANAKPFGLRVGDSSDSVIYAQKRLVHYGYLSSGHATGYYGSITEAAVKQFQKYNHLTQDGTVGRQTMACLESANAVKKPANVPQVTESGTTSGGGNGGGSSAGNSGGGSSGSASGVPSGSGSGTVSGGASTLLSIASSKLGCPYVWGSKGPNSFDCSGFVYYCLNQAGVGQSYITSSGWRNPGRYQRVSSYDDLRPGDILVVSGHVAIVAQGGTIIDASSSNGRVVHRNLSNWWRNNFIVGWRIFG